MSAVRKAVKAKVSTGTVVHLPIKSVHPDPHQPRKAFDEAALEALAQNIRERGILQPILVRADGERTVIVDGERRWRAAKLAKLQVVPTLRVDGDEVEQLRLDQVAVNQLREQLRPMDLARVLRDMRDAGRTTNEIAATLAKQGQALTPAKIDAMAKLTDLPDWTQAMVDAEEIEPAGAIKVLDVLDVKGIAKPLQKRLTQAAGYTGRIHTTNVTHEISRVLDDVLVDLNKVDSWAREPVHFAFKTRCKGCEHFKPFDSRGYCMDAKLFKEHNQEAKDAGLLPGGKRPDKPKPVTGKAAEKEVAQKTEQREFSLGEKARDYLHSYMARRLQGAVASMAPAGRWLVTWAALKKPGSHNTHGPLGVYFGGEAGAGAAGAMRITGLESIVDPNADVDSMIAAAAQEIVCDLPWRETQILARDFWGNQIENAWKLDTGFLDLFRKAELVHLAVQHECNPGDGRLWDRMKGDDMKAALLTQPERLARPAILVDLYEGEIGEPYKRWPLDDGPEDDEQFDDDSNDE